jgi:hypothetical protein
MPLEGEKLKEYTDGIGETAAYIHAARVNNDVAFCQGQIEQYNNGIRSRTENRGKKRDGSGPELLQAMDLFLRGREDGSHATHLDAYLDTVSLH